MSRNQRLMLVVAALAAAVIAFIVVSPGGDDDGKSDNTAAVETAPAKNDADTGGSTTPTTPSEPEATVVRIEIAGNEVQGGVKSIKVTKGDRVRIVVNADAADTLHLHGYDIEKEAQPGKPAVFAFTADIEGVFELESHTAEDAGLEPAVARLAVEPS